MYCIPDGEAPYGTPHGNPKKSHMGLGFFLSPTLKTRPWPYGTRSPRGTRGATPIPPCCSPGQKCADGGARARSSASLSSGIEVETAAALERRSAAKSHMELRAPYGTFGNSRPTDPAPAAAEPHMQARPAIDALGRLVIPDGLARGRIPPPFARSPTPAPEVCVSIVAALSLAVFSVCMPDGGCSCR